MTATTISPKQIPPKPEWTEPEKWVWTQLSRGEIADFNEKLGAELDPRKPKGWTKDRLISQTFLEDVFLHDPFNSALPRQGVYIVGAWLKEKIDLQHAKIEHPWLLINSRVESGVDLSYLHSSSVISFQGSVFTKKLSMEALSVSGHLFMRDGAEFKDIGLLGAKVGDQLDMTGAKVTGTLIMDALSVEAGLFMRDGAEFKDVDLLGAKVGGQLDMTGAKVAGTINMDGLSVDGSLFMRGGAEFKDVVLRSAKVGGQLDMTEAKITGTLDMDGLSVHASLAMRNGAEFKDIDLRSAKVGGQLDMSGVKVAGTLNMDGLSVDASLFMRDGAEFKDIVLRGTKVGGQFDMSGAKVTGMLNLDAFSVDADLFMSDSAEFKDVVFRGVKVGGQLDMSGAKTSGTLNMERLVLGTDLFMREKAEFNEVNIILAEIGGGINFSQAKLSHVNMSGTKVHGEVHLGTGRDQKPEWQAGSCLILRNTEIGALHDADEDSWPETMELDGFTYEHLGGLFDSERGIGERESKWFIQWLAKDKTFSPQPYQQLAKVLNTMGYSSKANDILFAGKDRERTEARASKRGKYIGLCLLKWTIGYGYGYRYFFSLLWVLGLTVIGTCVLASLPDSSFPNPEDAQQTLGMLKALGPKIAFSVDKLLPIIHLDDRFKLTFGGWQVYYFYFHELMGYLLGSFVVAGLSGITKK